MFRIPQPRLSGEILSEGVSNLMDRLLKQKLGQQEADYKNALLGIANKKLPLELRHLAAQAQKDEYETEQAKVWDSLWANANQPGNQSTTDSQTMPPTPQSSGQQAPGGQHFTYGGTQSDEATNANINRNGQSYNPNDVNQQSSNNVAPQVSTTTTPPPKLDLKQMEEKLKNGEEVEITPPRNPKLLYFDQFAGTNIPHTKYKLPKLETHTDQNGVRHTVYPSGRETIKKESMSQEEKAQVAIDVAEQKAQSQANIKRSESIKDTSQSLIDSMHKLKFMFDTLKANPNLGHPKYRYPYGVGENFLRRSPKSVADFDTAAGALQADYAKMEKSQPGIGLVNFYTKIKPDVGNVDERNYGMIEGNLKIVLEKFIGQKENWDLIHPNKKFPYKAPKFIFDMLPENMKAIDNGKKYINMNGEWHLFED